MHQPFLATIGVRDIVDELDLVDLRGIISADDLIAANYAPTIWSRKLRLIPKFLAHVVPHQCFQRGVENIEDQSAILNQVPMNRRQAGPLLLNGGQMLKRSER